MRSHDRPGRAALSTAAALLALCSAGLPAASARAQSAGSEPAEVLPAAATDATQPPGEPAAAVPAEPATAPMARDASPADELARARNLFAYGDYAAASDLLAELVLPGRLTGQDDLVDAHRMLGIAYALSDRRAEARRAFMALLYLAPDTRLDPFLTPPAVVEFFDSVAAEISDKLVEVRAQRAREREAEQQVPTVTVVERTVRQHPWYDALVPLGYPQFTRGAWGWGLWFLGAQGLGALAVAGTAVASLALIQDGALAADRKPLYDLLRVGNWLSAGALLVLYGGGVLESALSHESETLERERVREVPKDRVPALTPPRRKE